MIRQWAMIRQTRRSRRTSVEMSGSQSHHGDRESETEQPESRSHLSAGYTLARRLESGRRLCR
jgi:hypothetical protein